MKKIPIYKSSSHVARQQEHLLQTLFLNSFGSPHKTLYDHLMVMLQLSQNQPALNKAGVYIYTNELHFKGRLRSCPQISDKDGSVKYSSLPWYGISYDRKKITAQAPESLFEMDPPNFITLLWMSVVPAKNSLPLLLNWFLGSVERMQVVKI